MIVAFVVMTASPSFAQHADLESRRALHAATAMAQELYECSAWQQRVMEVTMDKLKIGDHNANPVTTDMQRKMVSFVLAVAAVEMRLQLPANTGLNKKLMW